MIDAQKINMDLHPTTVDGQLIYLGMTLWIVGEIPDVISEIVVTGIINNHGLVKLLNSNNVDAYPDWAYTSFVKAQVERKRLDVSLH